MSLRENIIDSTKNIWSVEHGFKQFYFCTFNIDFENTNIFIQVFQVFYEADLSDLNSFFLIEMLSDRKERA